jgi:hypothetical protein
MKNVKETNKISRRNCMSELVSETQKPDFPVDPVRIYSQSEVKAKQKASFVGGSILGAVGSVIGFLIGGVLINKIGNVNVIDKATEAVDNGIEKIKSLKDKNKDKPYEDE